MTRTRPFMVLLLGSLCAWACAQDVPDQTPPADEELPAVAWPEQDAAQPPPSADVMRPTEGKFRLTPTLIRLGSREWLRNGPFGDVEFDEQQEQVLSRRFSERVMEAAHKNGRKVRDFVETFMECNLAGRRGMTPEMKQRFGELGTEMVPLMRELIADFARDARPLLTDEQWETFKEDLRREFRNIDRAEGNLRRWADGQAREDEGLDDLDLEGQNSQEGSEDSGTKGRPRDTRTLRDARRRADADVRRLGFDSWRGFLASAKAFFHFDESQAARAEQLLGEYRRRAEPIVTLGWRRQVRENRVKYHLRGAIKEGIRPWVYHLEREYNGLVAPLVAVENEFRDRVIALATPAQRTDAVKEMRERAARHGLASDQLDEALLDLANEE